MHDKFTVRELPKGRRKIIGHKNYEFITPALMSFNFRNGGSVYQDLYMRDKGTGEAFRLARFETRPGIFNTEMIENAAIQTFTDTAAGILGITA